MFVGGLDETNAMQIDVAAMNVGADLERREIERQRFVSKSKRR